MEATLAAEGRAVKLEYVLAVPAARYGEFAEELRGAGRAPGWRHGRGWPRRRGDERRLVVAHDPEVVQRRGAGAAQGDGRSCRVGQQWGGRLDEQDAASAAAGGR